MKISEVRKILDQSFPDRPNWPGREAEIIVLSQICSSESQVIETMINPDSGYQKLIWDQQRKIEEADPEASIEFKEELEKLVHAQNIKEEGKGIEEHEELKDFLERNELNLTRAQLIVLYQNCRNLSDAADLLDSINFADLVYEMGLWLEEQDKDRRIENKSDTLQVHEGDISIKDRLLEEIQTEMQSGLTPGMLRTVFVGNPEVLQLLAEIGAIENKGEEK